jgi:hypothetical protein
MVVFVKYVQNVGVERFWKTDTCKAKEQNVTVEWLALLLPIR